MCDTNDGLLRLYALSAAEIGRMFGVTPRTVFRWVHTKPDFPKPILRAPKCTRWSAKDLADYLQRLESAMAEQRFEEVPSAACPGQSILVNPLLLDRAHRLLRDRVSYFLEHR